MIHNFEAGFQSHWKRIVPCRFQNSQTNAIYFHSASIIWRIPVCCKGSGVERREYITGAECNKIPSATKKPNEGQNEHKAESARKERCNSISPNDSLKETHQMGNVFSPSSFNGTWLGLAYVCDSQLKLEAYETESRLLKLSSSETSVNECTLLREGGSRWEALPRLIPGCGWKQCWIFPGMILLLLYVRDRLHYPLSFMICEIISLYDLGNKNIRT